MCHLSSCLKTVLNLYADDMLLYKQIKCSEDYQPLQLDIDKISSWVDSNHLSLNPANCKTMLLSRMRNLSYPPQFLLNKVLLEQVETFKYLGVLISSDLSWSKHVDSICAKGKKLIGLVQLTSGRRSCISPTVEHLSDYMGPREPQQPLE